MVWIIKITLLFFLIYSNNLFSNDLNNEEEMYFNFIDFNNDNQISFSEIEQSINIFFQLVDVNQDGFISKAEINELKSIVDSLR
tara:strand:- start:1107 stop:1358 length:252 start_codon:yes stop_codon:yes gene_type:complete